MSLKKCRDTDMGAADASVRPRCCGLDPGSNTLISALTLIDDNGEKVTRFVPLPEEGGLVVVFNAQGVPGG